MILNDSGKLPCSNYRARATLKCSKQSVIEAFSCVHMTTGVVYFLLLLPMFTICLKIYRPYALYIFLGIFLYILPT
jgi:hypothetical protein